MLAVDTVRRRKPLTGTPSPRLAPPRPARTSIERLQAAATTCAIDLMPWQTIAGRYITALGQGAAWLYREICIVVARQNGKTTLLMPRILMGLEAGERIIHTAQDGSLPLETFDELAALLDEHPNCLRIKRANGKETIYWKGGGRYSIFPPTRGIRGRHADLIIIDEVREQHDERLMKAILPTITARPNAQVIYLSNAGDPESVILNRLRERRETSATLAYLEWSADPDRDADDRRGWAQANPALGITITEDSLAEERERQSASAFETEHLCRWVAAIEDRLVTPDEWASQGFGALGKPVRPVMAINMDSERGRFSAIIAWRESDGHIALDVHDSRVDAEGLVALGPDLEKMVLANQVRVVGYDPYSDLDLARYLRDKGQAIRGETYANASSHFVDLVRARKLRVNDPDGVLGTDLTWTTRKTRPRGDGYMAVLADSDRSNTAAIAAIRAVWLASPPVNTAPARIY